MPDVVLLLHEQHGAGHRVEPKRAEPARRNLSKSWLSLGQIWPVVQKLT